jgi:predicted phosphohydrolase
MQERDSRVEPFKLAWATDVHLNFVDDAGRSAFADEVKATGANAVVLTGDIAEAPSVCRLLVEFAERVRLPTYFVLGNHDFYHGSVVEVRRQIRDLCSEHPFLFWLPACGPIWLAPDVALVGCDGWADGRFGDYGRSRVELNDYYLIEELARLDKVPRLTAMRRLADDSARGLLVDLGIAPSVGGKIMVATHVPPFAEACWHEGKISGPDWLPHFASKATGDVLLGAAETWPLVDFEVLCGHTHSSGVAQIRPNLLVKTGAAEYGAPKVHAVLEVGL